MSSYEISVTVYNVNCLELVPVANSMVVSDN